VNNITKIIIEKTCFLDVIENNKSIHMINHHFEREFTKKI